jgi:hypothetical protein
MKLLSQLEGERISGMEKVPEGGVDREAAWAGASEAPEIRRAAEPRRWSARMAIGTSQRGKPEGSELACRPFVELTRERQLFEKAVDVLDEFLTCEKQRAQVTDFAMVKTAANRPMRKIRICHR